MKRVVDLEQLEFLAGKATEGPWWIDSHGCTMVSMRSAEVVFSHPQNGKAVRHDDTGNLSHWRNDWDASFIAAANPEAVLFLLSEIKRLTAAGGDAKPSTCCPGEHLVPMHSTNTKLCTGCKAERPWPLDPGQKPLFARAEK